MVRSIMEERVYGGTQPGAIQGLEPRSPVRHAAATDGSPRCRMVNKSGALVKMHGIMPPSASRTRVFIFVPSTSLVFLAHLGLLCLFEVTIADVARANDI